MSDGWVDLEPAEPKPGPERDLDRNFVRTFDTNPGAQVLDYLRLTILDREMAPDCSDAALRHQEGRRSVVREILRMIERGKQ